MVMPFLARPFNNSYQHNLIKIKKFMKTAQYNPTNPLMIEPTIDWFGGYLSSDKDLACEIPLDDAKTLIDMLNAESYGMEVFDVAISDSRQLTPLPLRMITFNVWSIEYARFIKDMKKAGATTTAKELARWRSVHGSAIKKVSIYGLVEDGHSELVQRLPLMPKPKKLITRILDKIATAKTVLLQEPSHL